jgi:hypothetical protein
MLGRADRMPHQVCQASPERTPPGAIEAPARIHDFLHPSGMRLLAAHRRKARKAVSEASWLAGNGRRPGSAPAGPPASRPASTRSAPQR